MHAHVVFKPGPTLDTRTSARFAVNMLGETIHMLFGIVGSLAHHRRHLLLKNGSCHQAVVKTAFRCKK